MNKDLLDKMGFIVECESPLEISINEDPTAIATGLLAEILIEVVEAEHEARRKQFAEILAGQRAQYRKRTQKLPIFEEYTCAYCRNADTCEYAFDPYNTDGDCLMLK